MWSSGGKNRGVLGHNVVGGPIDGFWTSPFEFAEPLSIAGFDNSLNAKTSRNIYTKNKYKYPFLALVMGWKGLRS